MAHGPAARFATRRVRRQTAGVTLILVMSLISISLAVTYSVMRSQATTLTIQGNSNSRAEARQAAMAGLSIALGKMHEADWAGIDSTVAGDLSGSEHYEVTYATGDPSLTPGDADYDEYPFRVTLLATGTSTSQPGSTAIHRIRVVVQLVPRALSSQPNSWDEINNYTVYQHQDESTYIYPPVHVEGPVRLRGRLYWGEQPWFSSVGYSWGGTQQNAYLRGLETMRQIRGVDYRPMTGPIHLPENDQPYGLVSELESNQGVAVENASDDPLVWASGTELDSYRLYPGGKAYNVQSASSTIQYTALEPDVENNPLGLRYRNGTIDLRNSAQVKGSLITSSDIEISGRSVQLTPVSLPALYGTTKPIQLPTVLAFDDFKLESNAEATVDGIVMTGDVFEAEHGLPTTELNMQGRLVTGQLNLRERSTWDVTGLVWGTYYTVYELFKITDLNNTQFPEYLVLYSMSPAPKINIAPPAEEVTYHWLHPNTPVYAAHPDDGGLRWEMIEWTDGVN